MIVRAIQEAILEVLAVSLIYRIIAALLPCLQQQEGAPKAVFTSPWHSALVPASLPVSRLVTFCLHRCVLLPKNVFAAVIHAAWLAIDRHFPLWFYLSTPCFSPSHSLSCSSVFTSTFIGCLFAMFIPLLALLSQFSFVFCTLTINNDGFVHFGKRFQQV